MPDNKSAPGSVDMEENDTVHSDKKPTFNPLGSPVDSYKRALLHLKNCFDDDYILDAEPGKV